MHTCTSLQVRAHAGSRGRISTLSSTASLRFSYHWHWQALPAAPPVNVKDTWRAPGAGPGGGYTHSPHRDTPAGRPAAPDSRCAWACGG